MNLGTVPFSWFPLRSKWVKSGIDEIESGIGPDSLFEDKDRFFSEIRSPMLSGISPEIEFDDKFKALRFERRVIEVGIGPLMRLSDKSMNVRLEWKDFGMFPERLAWEMNLMSTKEKKKPYMISNGRRWFIILYPSVPLPPNAIQPDGLYYALDWDRVT
ncbi:hypothetical protein BRARA_A00984 [Brassica rapa]|uniref:Uncharacterized protein n=1 Tax=Brassica campestris TaxID=3711 RepID=A0A398AR71_BRACM|nr:hypothetical protein BRARA_A00984 [Brassica rapa]